MGDSESSWKEWFLNNKLRAVGAIWATSLAASLAYQWSRPIPTQLKVIHSRVYAQAITLAALGGAAAVDYLDHKSTTKEQLASYKDQLGKIEERITHASSQQELNELSSTRDKLERKIS